MPALSKREQIVTEALKLFYRNGFHATGIDRIISEAKVSKKTLYNHFRSKDELVLATLRKRDELFRNYIMRETELRSRTPRERLLAIFDVIEAWFQESSFSGCMFINASAEFSESDHPCHILCAEHKRLVREYLRDLAVQAEAQAPEELSKQLNLLIEGATVEAHVCGDHDAASPAKRIAEMLLNQAF
ncbi:MAG: TetR family transcriptional regulator [Kiritimatiellae bacterium]|nr:TetR family transcriptional regulator [Kiritimatiellia bacterium]